MILTKVFIPENHLKRESIHRFVYEYKCYKMDIKSGSHDITCLLKDEGAK